MKCDTYCLLVLWPLIFLFASKLAIEASHETLFAAAFAAALIVLPIRKLIVIVLARHFSYLYLKLVEGRGGLDCSIDLRKSNYCQLLMALLYNEDLYCSHQTSLCLLIQLFCMDNFRLRHHQKETSAGS